MYLVPETSVSCCHCFFHKLSLPHPNNAPGRSSIRSHLPPCFCPPGFLFFSKNIFEPPLPDVNVFECRTSSLSHTNRVCPFLFCRCFPLALCPSSREDFTHCKPQSGWTWSRLGRRVCLNMASIFTSYHQCTFPRAAEVSNKICFPPLFPRGFEF